MKPATNVTKRTLIKAGSALIAAGPLLGAARGAHAQPDLRSALLSQRDQLLRDLHARRTALPTNIVYVQSNVTTSGQNSILGFRRADDGSLTPLPNSPYLTGGTGYFVPSLMAGPPAADQQVVIDRLRGVLYAVNGGSNSVAAMRIAADGSLSHLPGSPFPTAGRNPSSLGLRLESLVVTNTDSSAAAVVGPNPSLEVFELDLAGSLRSIPSARTALASGSNPSQALTTDTGLFTFVCNLTGDNFGSYLTLALDGYGLVRLLDTQVPPQQAGATSVPLPLGLAAHPHAPVLYVGFATTEQLGVYRWDDYGRLTFLRSATNSGQAICWLRADREGRRLYTVNAADSSISVYDITAPEQPVEIQHLVFTEGAGIATQFEITPDQKYIYALEPGSSRADLVAGVLDVFPSQLHAFSINKAKGTVTEISSALLTLDLPADTIPQGVATL